MSAKKKEPRKVSLADAVSEAFGEIESLAEEMRSWADNLEEKFSNTSKYETVSETADQLESVSEPSLPDELPDLTVEYVDLPPRKRGYSRADRCGQANYILQVCCDLLDSEIEAHEKDEVDEPRDSLEALRDELESAKSETECCEFPGMYG